VCKVLGAGRKKAWSAEVRKVEEKKENPTHQGKEEKKFSTSFREKRKAKT